MDRHRFNYREKWRSGLEECKAQNGGRPRDGDRLQLMNEFALFNALNVRGSGIGVSVPRAVFNYIARIHSPSTKAMVLGGQ
jgi:hypothetical protein